MLKILGIAHDVDICSAAAIIDGEVVSAILARQRLQVLPFFLVLLSLPTPEWLARKGLASTAEGGELPVRAEPTA